MLPGPELTRLIKYGTVGVINTLVCLGVIALCKSLLMINPLVSNFAGYTAGLICSFFFNKTWVFKSTGKYTSEAFRFALGWGTCYLLQLGFLWLIWEHTTLKNFEHALGGYTLSGYGISTILAMVLYTVLNFLYNRFITFRNIK
ncbi:MAG: GtrA family protein [Muribaculaceae bacterium]|nr:GtrA family protein [Muribaculaceae bacterium]